MVFLWLCVLVVKREFVFPTESTEIHTESTENLVVFLWLCVLVVKREFVFPADDAEISQRVAEVPVVPPHKVAGSSHGKPCGLLVQLVFSW